jgi:hypothetical protein
MKIPVGQIVRNGGTQIREKIDWTTVDEYADDMRAGSIFPDITVFYDGIKYYLADGFHRVEAARKAELKEINAEVKPGTRRDAVLHAVGANASHGLRRTNADKRRAVMMLLEDKEWSQWSDREIARRCAVSKTFVSNMRPYLATDARYEQPTERKVNRGGTTYTQSTKNIGKRAEPGPMPEPDDWQEDMSFHSSQNTQQEPEDSPYTDAMIATQSLTDHIDFYMRRINSLEVRHEVVNNIIKHLRQLSIEYNRMANAN